MNPIIRNFLTVVRRFKLATALNILGLSVAFAAFIIIMIQVNYDYGFDRFHKDTDRIFRMEMMLNSSPAAIICRPLAEKFFESSPVIVGGAIADPFTGEAFFGVENSAGDIGYFKESSMRVSAGFTDVFAFDFIEGSGDALKVPDNIIIPLSMARKLFGNHPATGKQLVIDGKTRTTGAVYRDFPANSILTNSVYSLIPDSENKQNWGNWNYAAYIHVNDAAVVPQLFDSFIRNFDAKAAFGDDFDLEKAGFSLRFTALPDIHYVTGVQWDMTPKASRQTISVLFIIAIVITVIAGINFTNFSTALTPMRIKSINTQKVLGASQRSLRLSIVAEAVIISLLSYLIALGLVVLFGRSPLAGFVDVKPLLLSAHPFIAGGTAVIALLAGVLAGVYPACYMTSFAPALVLKGSFGLSPKGRKLRNALIGIQFIASFALLIGAAFIYLQNRYMQHSPLGYNKDALLTVNIGQIAGSREVIFDNIVAHSAIEDVTFSEMLLSGQDSYMQWGRPYRGEDIKYEVLPVHYSFLKVMGIEITEGRNFRREDEATLQGAYIFNETARRQYGLELNTAIDNSGEIVGFMPDVKFASFRTAVKPMAFYVWGTENWGNNLANMYVRVKAEAGVRAAMEHISTTLAGFNASYPFEVRFYDDVLQRLYEKETSLGTLITLFSAIAIFISTVGVFGLVVFDSEYRRREIGIRKVHGASTAGIIAMFNRAYMAVLLVCFAVAAPLAWFTVHRWLQSFAYRTPMHWWVCLLALAAIALVTSGTVTFQNWRVASDNPVKSLKND